MLLLKHRRKKQHDFESDANFRCILHISFLFLQFNTCRLPWKGNGNTAEQSFNFHLIRAFQISKTQETLMVSPLQYARPQSPNERPSNLTEWSVFQHGLCRGVKPLSMYLSNQLLKMLLKAASPLALKGRCSPPDAQIWIQKFFFYRQIQIQWVPYLGWQFQF